MSKKILTVLFVCAMMFVASVAMAAPGEVKKIESPKAEQKLVGGMPEFVIFKQNNGYIAIWTPCQIEFEDVCSESKDCMCEDCVIDYFYKKALNVTGSGSLDGFANGVDFFWGNGGSTTSNNGNNIGTYTVLQNGINNWVAISSGGKISIVIYGEGAPDPEDNFSVSFWMAVHFDKTTVNASTTTMSLIGNERKNTGQGFGYIEVKNLQVGCPLTCYLFAGSSNNGNTAAIAGASAKVSLERDGDHFVICIDLINCSATSATHIDVKPCTYDSNGKSIDPYDGLKLSPGQYMLNIAGGGTHFEVCCEQGNGKTGKNYALLWDLHGCIDTK